MADGNTDSPASADTENPIARKTSADGLETPTQMSFPAGITFEYGPIFRMRLALITIAEMLGHSGRAVKCQEDLTKLGARAMVLNMQAQRLHPIQEKILRLAQQQGLSKLSLREIGALVGDRSPQKIKHHIQQLEKRGLLRVDRVKGVIEKRRQGWIDGFLKKGRRLLQIPIVGVANCGPAEILADENVVGYLRISNALLHRQTNKGLFAVRADGFSMNQTKVNGKPIDDGDYVIVDGEDRTPREGDVILSIIDGAANVKRFHEDRKNGQVALLSDSDREFGPIYIHPDDDFFVNGKVIDVVKTPR